MPASAALPVPTMIAVGVARPMAQGQAMMSTVIVLTSANVSCGGGPTTNQIANVSGREADDQRHEPGADRVRQPLDGRLGALGGLDHAHDLAQHRVPAHARGPEHERCRWC